MEGCAVLKVRAASQASGPNQRVEDASEEASELGTPGGMITYFPSGIKPRGKLGNPGGTTVVRFPLRHDMCELENSAGGNTLNTIRAPARTKYSKYRTDSHGLLLRNTG